MAVELIPGTGLPLHVGPGGEQPEGRGTVQITDDRAPRPIVDRNAPVAGALSPQEMAFVQAAIAAFDRGHRKLKTIFDTAAGVTDATTGNIVIPLFVCPGGCEAHVTNVLVDTPQAAATIAPSVPFSNAATWAFLAIAGASTGRSPGDADSLRPGMVTFAPNPASGTNAVLPFQWTFTDAPAPTLFGGDQLYYVLHGGSQATVKAITVQVTYKVELFGYENGQL